MLKMEEAQQRLKAWKHFEEDGEGLLYQGTVEKLISKLPAKDKKLLGQMFGIDEYVGEVNWYDRMALSDAAATQLNELPVKSRVKLFSALAPRLGPIIEDTWQLLTTTPYEVSHDRKAFRAPQDPSVTVRKQASWLSSLTRTVFASYEGDVITPTWLATWAAYLNQGYFSAADEIGCLLATLLRSKTSEADEVYEILRQSLTNQHEIGATGRHVYRAMLLADRKAGWELMEKTLLAAQRQEGVRQAILEAVDESHPEAFRRMLQLILDHDLLRFSSVVRAADVWFGEAWAAASAGVVKKALTQVVQFLDDPAARQKALAGRDAEEAFHALWCVATEDAHASIAPAAKLLAAKSPEVRFAALQHLVNLQLPQAYIAVWPALSDEHLLVAARAATVVSQPWDAASIKGVKDDRFERLEALVARSPERPTKLKPLVWPWTGTEYSQDSVVNSLIDVVGDRPPGRLLKHLPNFDPRRRREVVCLLAKPKRPDKESLDTLVKLVGDATAGVRAEVFKALEKQILTAEHYQSLTGLLTRKSGDVRRGVIELLASQSDKAALASATGLLEGDAQQRLGGLELLRSLVESNRVKTMCREQATEYQTARKKISPEEKAHLDAILTERAAVPTLDDALGLFNPADRSKPVAPRKVKTLFITPAAIACLKSLDELVHKHRETTIKTTWFGAKEQDELLGQINYGFPDFDPKKPRAGQEQKLPLAAVWREWFQKRGKALRDADGLELLRAGVYLRQCTGYDLSEWKQWTKGNRTRQQLAEKLWGKLTDLKLRYESVISAVLGWLLFLQPVEGTDYLLDALEAALAMVPPEDMKKLIVPVPKEGEADVEVDDWREAPAFELWLDAVSYEFNRLDNNESPEQLRRYWQLLHWCDEPVPGARRSRVRAEVLLKAYAIGAANLADVTDHMLAPRSAERYGNECFSLLCELTTRDAAERFKDWETEHPDFLDLVRRAVARILDVELSRGDAETPATEPAASLRSLRGIETLRRILATLGKADFKLGQRWSHKRAERRESLTRLAKITFPAEGETPEDFLRTMKAAVGANQFPEERLLQLVFLAPQWVKHLEAYFGWPEMSEGVYWFLAHMRYVGGLEDAADALEEESSGEEDEATASAESAEASSDEDDGDESGDKPSQRKLSAWERMLLERTPLTRDERAQGAIDVAWFRRTHEKLGDKRWQQLAGAARFAANASQAKKAQFIAEVLLNKIPRKQLIEGIKKKQLKDHVRLLGLLPLAGGAKRDADFLERCRELREYRRYANTLSGLTKPEALRACEIGMKNLAQTAGYPDPLRLEWAVGAETVKDLAKGPVTVISGAVIVTLALDEFSKPVVTTTKDGKELKTTPQAVKKEKKVAELLARVTDLKRQASGIRQSLEACMCRGDEFSGLELRNWCGHALLAPLLSRLIVVGEGIFGYPDKAGQALRDHRGKLEPVKPNERLRLAHPHDLLAAGDWHAWQKECFEAERVQPFKQIFRELYVVTRQEQRDDHVSRRYDGQQIQAKQALALFGTRGWNTGDGVFKVFHDLGMTACVDFSFGVTTPAEVEGSTISGVYFHRRDDWKPMPLADVPPRLFSEVMRDLDLVVSVAHAGGVDPEASASTVEMRSSLLRETCSLLKLDNVRFQPSHAVIDGQIAQYSVHLGSGVVHRMPGGSVCLVPVHAQHRGRLFLPFADDDPRTAEVVSKVLMLARDNEIQDPVVLEQLRR